MAKVDTVLCDHCAGDCTHRFIEVTLVVAEPVLAEDTRPKQYCSASHAELGMDNTGGIPRG